MALMAKANRQITVPDGLREDYLARGYDEINAQGKVIIASRAGIPLTARKELDALQAENKALKAELDALRAEKQTKGTKSK